MAADSVAYQTGAFVGQILIFIIGACLIASGRSDRRSRRKGDGTAKIGIGAVLLLLLVASLLTSI